MGGRREGKRNADVKFNRNRWAGLAALALIGGLLAPVVTAPAAQAATIPVTDADCINILPGTPITGAPGDVVSITSNLTGCTDLLIFAGVVDTASDIDVRDGSGLLTPTAVGGGSWLVSSGSVFTQIEITLGSTNGTASPGLNIGGNTGGTTWDVTISGSAPNPPAPTPTPATPPSAPAFAEATAGNGEVTVSWTAPTSQGSFPVTNYQVQSMPSSQGCLVPVTATTCRIGGLRNGVAYTFQVRALNGGGWGSWATTESVTPRPEPDPEASIMITGTRSANDRVARVKGETTGLTGATLQSMVRLSTQTEFTAGSTRRVNAQGEFTWKRRAMATVGVEVYFTAGDIASNTVTIAGR